VPGDPNLVSLEVGVDGLVYGLSSNSTLFVFAPDRKQVMQRQGLAAYGGVPRQALHGAPDGSLYALLSAAIVRITPATLAVEKLATPPVSISAGGALADGRLYFASGAHLWSYSLGAR